MVDNVVGSSGWVSMLAAGASGTSGSRAGGSSRSGTKPAGDMGMGDNGEDNGDACAGDEGAGDVCGEVGGDEGGREENGCASGEDKGCSSGEDMGMSWSTSDDKSGDFERKPGSVAGAGSEKRRLMDGGGEVAGRESVTSERWLRQDTLGGRGSCQRPRSSEVWKYVDLTWKPVSACSSLMSSSSSFCSSSLSDMKTGSNTGSGSLRSAGSQSDSKLLDSASDEVAMAPNMLLKLGSLQMDLPLCVDTGESSGVQWELPDTMYGLERLTDAGDDGGGDDAAADDPEECEYGYRDDPELDGQ